MVGPPSLRYGAVKMGERGIVLLGDGTQGGAPRFAGLQMANLRFQKPEAKKALARLMAACPFGAAKCLRSLAPTARH